MVCNHFEGSKRGPQWQKVENYLSNMYVKQKSLKFCGELLLLLKLHFLLVFGHSNSEIIESCLRVYISM